VKDYISKFYPRATKNPLPFRLGIFCFKSANNGAGVSRAVNYAEPPLKAGLNFQPTAETVGWRA